MSGPRLLPCAAHISSAQTKATSDRTQQCSTGCGRSNTHDGLRTAPTNIHNICNGGHRYSPCDVGEGSEKRVEVCVTNLCVCGGGGAEVLMCAYA